MIYNGLKKECETLEDENEDQKEMMRRFSELCKDHRLRCEANYRLLVNLIFKVVREKYESDPKES